MRCVPFDKFLLVPCDGAYCFHGVFHEVFHRQLPAGAAWGCVYGIAFHLVGPPPGRTSSRAALCRGAMTVAESVGTVELIFIYKVPNDN